MLFDYHIKNKDEFVLNGVIEADSVQEAMVRLRAQNYKIIEIQPRRKTNKNKKNYLNEYDLVDFFSNYIFFKSNHIDEGQVLELMQIHCSSYKVRRCCREIQSSVNHEQSILQALATSNFYLDNAIKPVLLSGLAHHNSNLELAELVYNSLIQQLEHYQYLIELEMKSYLGLCLFIAQLGVVHFYFNLNQNWILHAGIGPQLLTQFLSRYHFSSSHLFLYYFISIIVIYFLVRPMFQNRLYLVNSLTQIKLKYQSLRMLLHLDLIVKQGNTIKQSLNRLLVQKDVESILALRVQSLKNHSQNDYKTKLSVLTQLETFSEDPNEVQRALTHLIKDFSLQFKSEFFETKGFFSGILICFVFSSVMLLIYGLSVFPGKGI